MCYIPSDMLRPHKIVWKQQKDHFLYWDVSFSQSDNSFTDYWVILLVFSVQSTEQNLNLEAITWYRVHIIHRLHNGLHHSIAQVHLACKHSLLSSTFIPSAFHGRVFSRHTEKSPHYWQSSFQGISLINIPFVLFSRSNIMRLEAVAHRILHVGCACINYVPWRTLPKTTYAIWIPL